MDPCRKVINFDPVVYVNTSLPLVNVKRIMNDPEFHPIITNVAEFWLDGGGVNSFIMEELFDVSGNSPVMLVVAATMMELFN